MAGHLPNAGHGVLAIVPSAERRRGAVAQGLRCMRAAAVGHISDGPPRGNSPQSGAGPMAVDGRRLERAVVPDEFEKLRRDPGELGRRLTAHFWACPC
jgi:hypothetical protein